MYKHLNDDSLIIHFNASNVDGLGNSGKSFQDQSVNPTQMVNLTRFVYPDGTKPQLELNAFGYDAISGFGRDVHGDYLLFDGSDDYAEITNTSSLVLTNMTIQMIIKPVTFVNYSQYFSSRNSTGTGGYYIGTYDAANFNNLTLNAYSPGGSQISINPAGDLSTTAVTNVAAVFKSNQIYQYINTSDYWQNGYTTHPATDNNWRLGSTATGAVFTNFKMYDIKIYNRELTLAEISRNYMAENDTRIKDGVIRRRTK